MVGDVPPAQLAAAACAWAMPVRVQRNVDVALGQLCAFQSVSPWRRNQNARGISPGVRRAPPACASPAAPPGAPACAAKCAAQWAGVSRSRRASPRTRHRTAPRRRPNRCRSAIPCRSAIASSSAKALSTISLPRGLHSLFVGASWRGVRRPRTMREKPCMCTRRDAVVHRLHGARLALESSGISFASGLVRASQSAIAGYSVSTVLSSRTSVGTRAFGLTGVTLRSAGGCAGRPWPARTACRSPRAARGCRASRRRANNTVSSWFPLD